MKGTVFQYDKSNHTGVITGYDGVRYPFLEKDWMGNKDPKIGVKVDFETLENSAISIYSHDKAPVIVWKPFVAILVTIFIFLGALDEADWDTYIGASLIAYIPVVLTTISLSRDEGWKVVSIISLVITIFSLLVILGQLSE